MKVNQTPAVLGAIVGFVVGLFLVLLCASADQQNKILLAQTIVLAVTAVAAGWYAWEARKSTRAAIEQARVTARLADETRSLAKSSYAMTKANVWCDLYLGPPEDDEARYTCARLHNRGPGIALAVKVTAIGGDQDAGITLPGDVMEPGSSWPVTCFGERPPKLILHWNDVLGPGGVQQYYFDEHIGTWVCEEDRSSLALQEHPPHNDGS